MKWHALKHFALIRKSRKKTNTSTKAFLKCVFGWHVQKHFSLHAYWSVNQWVCAPRAYFMSGTLVQSRLWSCISERDWKESFLSIYFSSKQSYGFEQPSLLFHVRCSVHSESSQNKGDKLSAKVFLISLSTRVSHFTRWKFQVVHISVAAGASRCHISPHHHADYIITIFHKFVSSHVYIEVSCIL